jgi:PRC-barrel domain
MAVRRSEERLRFCLVACIQPRGGTLGYRKTRTGSLIGSDKVEGTAVYGADNEKIGSIERVMIEKQSGKVSYAVLGFGGFLGIGEDHYPLPWQSLKYDTSLEGYRTNVTKQQLEGAPKYTDENSWNWEDPSCTRTVNDYYAGF